mmetsp:Transcript_22499/g.69827  ORF Transcript_22499/g.69827 Transcript_22499/m.69827 type:complete len:264 (+) Transcript_22499:126-917(+)
MDGEAAERSARPIHHPRGCGICCVGCLCRARARGLGGGRDHRRPLGGRILAPARQRGLPRALHAGVPADRCCLIRDRGCGGKRAGQSARERPRPRLPWDPGPLAHGYGGRLHGGPGGRGLGGRRGPAGARGGGRAGGGRRLGVVRGARLLPRCGQGSDRGGSALCRPPTRGQGWSHGVSHCRVAARAGRGGLHCGVVSRGVEARVEVPLGGRWHHTEHPHQVERLERRNTLHGACALPLAGRHTHRARGDVEQFPHLYCHGDW